MPETSVHPKGAYIDLEGIDAERAAMLLALSRDRQEEESLKQAILKNEGTKALVIEIGGMTENVRQKIVPSVMAACVNQGIIKRKSMHAHALVHAVIEAEKGLTVDAPASGSFSLKVAVVVMKDWVAVAMFGESAFHVLTNHRRAGLGVMHFPD